MLDSFVSNVMTSYKADVSDHKAKLRDLKGAEKDHEKAVLASLEAQNRGIDASIAKWGKIALGVGAAFAAVKIGADAMDSYFEDVRLESAAAGADIGKLTQATAGLIEQDDLLAFAGKSMHGVWKLNNSEMQTVLHGAMALRKTMGVELTPTIQAMTDALAKGSTRAFKEFGIEAKDKEGVLRELARLWGEVGGKAGLAGDDIQRTKVSLADAMDDIKGQFGRLLVELMPAIKSFGELAKTIAGATKAFMDWSSRFTDSMAGADTQGGKASTQMLRQLSGMKEDLAYYERNAESYKYKDEDKGQHFAALARSTKLEVESLQRQIELTKIKEYQAEHYNKLFTVVLDDTKKISESTKKIAHHVSAVEAMKPEELFSLIASVKGMGSAFASVGSGIAKDVKLGAAGYQKFEAEGFAAQGASVQAEAKVLSEGVDAINSALANLHFNSDGTLKGASLAEQIFGDKDQLDFAIGGKDLMIGALKEIGDATADAMTNAIVYGQSFAASMNKALASVLMGLSKEFFVRSIGALATGNFGAAGLWAAGGAAAALAARELGAGASSSPPSVSSAGGAYHTSSSGSFYGGAPGERNTTIILDDSFYDDTPRARQQRLKRAVNTGMNSGGANVVRHM